MNIFIPRSKTLNKVYLFLLLGLITVSQSSCFFQYYTPSSTVSYSGTTTYCQNDVATPNTLTYGECTLGGGIFTAGVVCTAQWYYNTTGGTVIATSTPLGGPVGFTTPAGGTGTLNYTPLTTTPGTFYYFTNVTWVAGSTCTGPFTSGTQTVVINPPPTAILGTYTVCVGANTTLTDATGSGAWSSGNPAIATVAPGTGVVTGVALGTATISYTVGGCSATVVVTVNTGTTPIAGTATVCVGSTTALTDPTGGGTWSGGGVNASVSATGVVTGLNPGTDVIIYTVGSCNATQIVTVTAAPPAISGLATVCIGFTSALTDATGGGSWSTSAGTGSVTIDAFGVMTGVSAGTATVTYTTSSTCWVTEVVTVTPVPSAIIGPTSVCQGSSTSVIDLVTGGTWSSSNTLVATIGSSGSPTTLIGVGAGTTIITYSFGGTCYVTSVMTVNGTPSAISGATLLCAGGISICGNATTGGTWSSSTPGVATIGSSTGIVTAGVIGTSSITYTTGCAPDATVVVTVTAAPTVIGGVTSMCVGATSTLTNGSAGGTWSTTPGTGSVTVNPSTGLVTGVTQGTATVFYTTGCPVPASIIVTVTPSPTPLTGFTSMCVGLATTLNSTPAGGTWTTTAGTGSVNVVGGVVTGLTVGTANVTYTLATCYVTTTVTVNTTPTAITGNVPVCVGMNVTLNSTPAGGIWSTSAGSGSVAIGAATGVITGGTAGNATVTYSLGAGCTATATVTVNNNPTAITGNSPVCVGFTATLNSTPAGGVWSTSAGSGSVGIAGGTGVITGTTAGNATVTYTLGTGCYATATVTVNTQPTAITSNTPVCMGLTATLNSTPAGGVWSTSAGSGSVGIGAATGIITGATAGNATVTYTLAGGCNVTATVTVNSNPTVITGNVPVCVGLTATLNSTPAGGTWSTSAGSGSVGIGAATGVITGATAGNATVTYTLGTGCIVTATVTVNANPTVVTGNVPVCVGLTATLNSTPAGGTWTTTAGTGSVGIGAATGIITGATAGTANVTYTLGTGCNVTDIATVNPNPTVITGNAPVCVGYTITLNSTPAGGTWSAGAGSGSVGIGGGTGVVGGITAGTVSVTYSLATGCDVTAIVTVNTTPATITGNVPVCVGLTATLNSTPAGGTWTTTAGTGSVGIGAATGIITGSTAGTANVTYTLGTGCQVTDIVTVNANPTAITGNAPVCVGLTATLNSTPAGGVWSTSAGSGSVGIVAGTGVITGTTAGNATVTYSLSTGCIATATVTVNANPTVITGNAPVCVGLTATLNSTPAGGTWTTSAGSGSVGIGAGTGIITGTTAGNATVTYTLGTGCIATATVTVNGNPTAITGNVPVCIGLTTTLNSTPAGGTWSASAGSGSVGIGAGTGVVTGTTAGTANVTYTLGTGCNVTAIVTINSNPSVITGNSPVCVGLTATLNSTPAGGTWSTAAGTGSVGIGAGTGIITGATAGNATVTYTLATGCISTATVTINANPTPLTGGTAMCTGLTTTLTTTPAGGTWTSSNGNATVSAAGIVTGNIVGTSTITYALGTGCIATVVVTVTAAPGPITGIKTVCVGAITALTDGGGGTWATSNTNTSVDGSGNVTGLLVGTSTITYTLGTGCTAVTDVTVNPNPTAITGNIPVCVGLTTTLNSTPAGGNWSTSAGSGSAGIGAATGIITGSAAGTATVSYTIGTGCFVTAIATVNPNPTAITGNTPVCVGLTTTLNSTPGGGIWSASAGTGSVGIGAGTGIVTGTTPGTATVTYTLGTGCLNTAVVTINPNPTAVTGNVPVCVGLTATLNSTPAGGTWSASAGSGSIGIGAATGVMTGTTAGNANITYTLSTGCIVTAIATINPNPTAITGNTPVCVGLTATLNSTPAGGTWSASAGSGSIGIVAGTGVITGLTGGTANVTYTLGTGCIMTAIVTVNANPTAITGNVPVCVGLTATLNSTPAGGTWSAGAGSGSVGIGAGTGIITGGTAGNATVTYTLATGCINTATVTVNPLPAAISGGLAVCVGFTTSLNDITGGGSWSASNANATIGAGTGIVTGNTNGTDIITYTLPTGCIMTAVVTVNSTPAGILGTLVVCSGLTTSLSNLTAGGTWSSNNVPVAFIGSGTGILTGALAGTATITYAIGSGCYVTAVATVNPLPTAILGSLTVCSGLTTSLSDATAGGAWTSSNPLVGSISSTGVVSAIIAGTTIITYTLPTGCLITAVVTVNPSPVSGSITGTLTLCPATTTALTDVATGGIWSSISPLVGTVSTSGVVSGLTAGTSTISYTVTNSCGTVAATAVVTVNPIPNAGTITGTFSVCPALTTALTDVTGTGPGVWSSVSPGVAAVGTSGIVLGLTAGTSTISFAVTNSCGTAYTSAVVTVNPSPFAAPISGVLILCPAASTTLTDAVAGGVWSSSVTAVASITSSGLWTGGGLGTSTISYAVTNVCGTAYATAIATVDPAPIAGFIMGGSLVCPATSVTLSDPSSGGGGVWSSSPTAIATVGSGSGIVTGVTPGTATITYSITNSCGTATTMTVITVHPTPTAIVGPDVLCQGNAINLSDSITDGAWSSSNTVIAIVSAGIGTTPVGVVSGLSVGTATISYVVAPGCFATKTVTVNLLGTVSAASHMCVGESQVVTDIPGGGVWSTSNPGVATINTTGTVTAIASGVTGISYTMGVGCTTGVYVTVNILPFNYDVTGGGSYCAGATGEHIGLNGSDTGITYTLYFGASPIATLLGTGAPLDFGTYLLSGTYTIIAKNNVTGCSQAMAGNAVITINTPVPPSVTLTVSPGTTICAGAVATFTPTPVNGGLTPTYDWYVNGGTSVATGSTYSYIPLSGDVVSVKLHSSASCVLPDTAMGSVTMTTTTSLTPSVTLSVSPGDSVCAGTPVFITPNPVNGGATPLYSWIKNGIYQGTGSTYVFLPADGDYISCQMYSSLTCRSLDSVASANDIHMIVPAVAAPSVSITAIPGSNIVPGTTVTLTANVSFSGSGGLSYQWTINGVAVPGATNSTYINSTFTNNDTVACDVTGYSPCGSMDESGYIIIFDTVATGIHDLQGKTDLVLVPNPNNGTFNLKGSLPPEGATLKITDMLGQVVYEEKIKGHGKINEQIQVSNTLANGMYLLNVKSDTENLVFHFVIEK